MPKQSKTYASVTGSICGRAWSGYAAELPMAATIPRDSRAPLRALIRSMAGDFERAESFYGIVTFRRIIGRGRIVLQERAIVMTL